jgi:hypothetical protein
MVPRSPAGADTEEQRAAGRIGPPLWRYRPCGLRLDPVARSDPGLTGIGAVPHGEGPDMQRDPNCRMGESG